MWGTLALGVASGLMNAYGANKQNKNQAALFNPGIINKRASQLNPGAYLASDQPGYQQAWRNLGQNPGYIDPSLQAYAMNQNDRGWQQALQRLQGMIGRSGQLGGMGQAHTLAAFGGQAMGRGRIAQQFALWQEQQRRADMQMIANQRAQAQGQAMGISQQQAQYPQVPWQSTLGNAIQGGLAAYGSMGGGGNMFQRTPTWYNGITGGINTGNGGVAM